MRCANKFAPTRDVRLKSDPQGLASRLAPPLLWVRLQSDIPPASCRVLRDVRRGLQVLVAYFEGRGRKALSDACPAIEEVHASPDIEDITPTAPAFVDIVFNPGMYQLSGNPFRDVGAKRLVGACGRYVAQLWALRPRTVAERSDLSKPSSLAPVQVE